MPLSLNSDFQKAEGISLVVDCYNWEIGYISVNEKGILFENILMSNKNPLVNVEALTLSSPSEYHVGYYEETSLP